MVTTTYLPGPSTTGYTERREATFNDDGSLQQVVIIVDWADGTSHEQSINIAADHSITTSGGLAYPDGSRTSISVPADGGLQITHDWRYESPPDAIVDKRNGTDTWDIRPDGTGTQTSVTEHDDGTRWGIDKEWHDFNPDGGFAGDVHSVSTEVDRQTGIQTTIETTIDVDGKRTQHTKVEDADGVLIADDTLITFTNPPAEPPPQVRGISRRRGKTEEPDAPPSDGPQAVAARAATAAGGGGGICGFARAVAGGSSGGELCEHYTDYYLVREMVTVEGKQEPGTGLTYLGSRFHGVGAC